MLDEEMRQMTAVSPAKEQPQTPRAALPENEAWMKPGQQLFGSRAHFFAGAAQTLRRMLIERLPRRGRPEPGADLDRVGHNASQTNGAVSEDQPPEANEAIEELEVRDRAEAKIGQACIFAGRENAESVALLGVSELKLRRENHVPLTNQKLITRPDHSIPSPSILSGGNRRKQHGMTQRRDTPDCVSIAKAKRSSSL